ncbi:ribonuclease H-like domain-containing protein [Rhizophagus clarus]|uniref:Ribonuclease H-like domain-containing protein n=1 Tax=Rhizophagus clarus TaxID=94130 RepID=A0A8H3MA98_9GLOM|nr:ribonuclease H-like domain-containing protein [Rhizophagus clarus]
MFLDQIIQPDSAFFKSWNEIKNSLHNKKGPIPLWYKHMINQYTLNPNNLRLNFDLPHLPQQTLHVKRLKKGFNSPNQTICPRNSWAHFWSPSVKDTTYGKILSKDNHNPNSPMMIMEHWVLCPIIDNSNDTREHTPNSRPNFLQPCKGCSLHYPYYIADLRPKTTERHTKKRVQTTQSHHSLRILAYNDYLRTHQLLDIESYRTFDNISLSSNFILNRYPLTFLHHFFLLSSDTVVTLFNFYETLSSFSLDTIIEIYTDGACNLEQRQDITMGIGWHITQPSTPLPITFSGSCKHFPSSTKAEAYAICTALLICPPRSKVNIYTDSLCCINTFHTITNALPHQDDN